MTNIVVGLCSIVLVLVAAIGSLGQAFVAHSRAQSAADLAALAAADAVRGLATGEPCEMAKEVAIRNGGHLKDCRASLSEQSAYVVIEVDIPGPLPKVREEAVAGK
ncbi:MAG: Rv3654c family TadE-like protein [Brevibacterium sp.]|uniref:Helicase/secretion neighborhood TadE-like protein n=1 Tax=Brevibacterium linens ATCC 9172 TaxID=1255617 RepID=A0A2H1KCA9_BRELN|nr:Rv3654c family TadE-like protein [Brevibacterium linens]KAB1945462.1 flp pilus-assembly TadE/G-like family protein [Brevibacterium linens ATCC 9172]SMX97411.1 helicase/secretion neighborhood TadE-like protein [Brevibacterium linens ATCC 9172]